MQEKKWAQIRSTASLVEADMLKNLLSSEGINALVQPSDASAYLGVMSACRLFVRAEDVAPALAFLDDWERGDRELEPDSGVTG
jgi:hypothetical protein